MIIINGIYIPSLNIKGKVNDLFIMAQLKLEKFSGTIIIFFTQISLVFHCQSYTLQILSDTF